MSELTNLEPIQEKTFKAPTTWTDNETLLNARNLGNNSAAIQELQNYLNNTTTPKINDIIICIAYWINANISPTCITPWSTL